MAGEKPAGVIAAREAMLARYFPPELVERAVGRLSDALDARSMSGHPLHTIQVRAAESIIDRVLPRAEHGNSRQAGQPVVVVIQPAFAALMPKPAKRLTE